MTNKYQAKVIIIKHVSGFEMTYGIYDTFYKAAEALKYLKSINSIDTCVIEESYLSDSTDVIYSQH